MRAISVIEKQVGADRVACVVIEPIQGEGGFVVPADGFLPAIAAVVHGQRGGLRRRRDPDRLRPHRRDVRLRARGRRPGPRSPPPRASPAACRSPPSPAAPRSWTPCTAAASAAPTAATPSPAPRALGAIATIEQQDLAAARPAHRGHHGRRGCATCRPRYPQIGDVRGRGAMLAVEIVEPGTTDPDAAETVAGQHRLPPGRPGHADLRHLRQRAALPAAARHRRGPAPRGPGRPRGRLRGLTRAPARPTPRAQPAAPGPRQVRRGVDGDDLGAAVLPEPHDGERGGRDPGPPHPLVADVERLLDDGAHGRHMGHDEHALRPAARRRARARAAGPGPRRRRGPPRRAGPRSSSPARRAARRGNRSATSPYVRPSQAPNDGLDPALVERRRRPGAGQRAGRRPARSAGCAASATPRPRSGAARRAARRPARRAGRPPRRGGRRPARRARTAPGPRRPGPANRPASVSARCGRAGRPAASSARPGRRGAVPGPSP